MEYSISYHSKDKAGTPIVKHEHYVCLKPMGLSAPFVVLYTDEDKEVFFNMNDVIRIERDVQQIEVPQSQLIRS